MDPDQNEAVEAIVEVATEAVAAVSVEQTPEAESVSESAAEVAAAAAAVAHAATIADPISQAWLERQFLDLSETLGRVAVRLEKVEADIFLALGKLDELISLELEEAENVEVEEETEVAVVASGEGGIVAETIPPETAQVIEEPEQRRKKARRFI